MIKISGKFDVNLTPLESSSSGDHGVVLGRMTIEKTFHGELSANSRGEMLSAITTNEGSAGYVAIEQVTGTLGGKSGSFVLQHYGIMNKGEERLILEVLPDSSSGELSGLTGSMQIIHQDGEHFYEFEYQLRK